MTAVPMQISLHLPDQTLYQGKARKLSATAEGGAFTLLPRHADHVAALVACVMVLETPQGEEVFFGIDDGVLVKRGHEISIVVRRAVQGDSLDTLAHTVAHTFKALDESERAARSALSRLEIGIVRQFSALRTPQT